MLISIVCGVIKMPDAASTSAITVASKSGLLSLTHRYGSTRWIFSAAEESDSEFEKAASKLDPLLRRALVEDIVDDDDTALVEKLGCEKLTQTRSVLRRKAALSPAGCAAPVSYTHLRAHETRHDLV